MTGFPSPALTMTTYRHLFTIILMKAPLMRAEVMTMNAVRNFLDFHSKFFCYTEENITENTEADTEEIEG